jgi:uncharacterized membrane protein YedE/YeeE
MFESLGFEDITAKYISVLFGLGLGVLFGVFAERTKFCFRRSLVGDDRKQATGVWLMALAIAVLGTQGAVAAGWISFDEHRFMTTDIPVLAIAIGGVLFGAGMVLTRGCVSRLTVLSGTGNLRALTVLLVFAVVAHATLKGMLAPVRTTLASITVPVQSASLGDWVGAAWAPALVIAAVAIFFAIRSGNRARTLVLAAALGALVPLGWVGTGYVLFDEFDPIAMESLSFTAPATEALFWTIAGTAIPAGFGTGLFGGVLAGALVASLIFGSFAWQSFGSPRETGRYGAGAALMGVGGVLAGGCTVGAGLAGIPSLSIAALLAIAFMAIGALATNALLNRGDVAGDAPSAKPALQPAG